MPKLKELQGGELFSSEFYPGLIFIKEGADQHGRIRYNRLNRWGYKMYRVSPHLPNEVEVNIITKSEYEQWKQHKKK